MQKIKNILFSIIFLSGMNLVFAQNINLLKLSYEEIEKKIDNSKDNHEKWQLINIYIIKSKVEKNDESLLYAYRYASNLSSFPKSIKYADSAIIVANKSQNKKLLTNAYINRGIVLMNNSMYQQSLDDILKANEYSIYLADQYTINKTSYYIAQNKIYLGLYEDANKELESCIKYFRNNAENKPSFGKDYQMYYLYSLMSYIDSNTRIGKQKENEILLQEAFQYVKAKKLRNFLPYFISSQGTDAYYSKDYQTAIKKLTEAIRLYNDNWPHITEIYYLGLSHWKINKKFTAVKYLEEIDKEYNQTNKLDPQFRSAYELLIKYNDSIGNRDKQLEYINKLMVLDRSYEKNYKYLYTKINKEYDTQKLLQEKNKIEKTYRLQRLILTLLLLASIAFILFFIYRYSKLQKFYKERFEEIVSEKPSEEQPILSETSEKDKIMELKPNKTFDEEYYNKIPGLNPLFVENILNLLKEFEKDEKYLDSQVSQRMLSETFGTNSSYLSKIINVYKNKNFNTYINDLRLDFFINFLKTDSRNLNMDVKELANISGFTNSENFSNQFQRKYQIKPSVFIKMMKENIRTSAQ